MAMYENTYEDYFPQLNRTMYDSEGYSYRWIGRLFVLSRNEGIFACASAEPHRINAPYANGKFVKGVDYEISYTIITSTPRLKVTKLRFPSKKLVLGETTNKNKADYMYFPYTFDTGATNTLGTVFRHNNSCNTLRADNSVSSLTLEGLNAVKNDTDVI